METSPEASGGSPALAQRWPATAELLECRQRARCCCSVHDLLVGFKAGQTHINSVSLTLLPTVNLNRKEVYSKQEEVTWCEPQRAF